MNDFYREHLREALDEHGDVVPPWEAFPQYRHGSTGWRMGPGESLLGYFWAFLAELPDEREVRMEYLRRHALAPHTWAGWVARILDRRGLALLGLEPDEGESMDDLWEEDDWDTVTDEAFAHVLDLGLLGEDVAYKTWRAQTERITWPWESGRSPANIVPSLSRDYWFWSRWARELREAGGLQLDRTPWSWRKEREALLSGSRPRLNPKNGEETLALALCAGEPPGPWEFGLNPKDAAEYHGGGYASAYTRWVYSCFDDRPTLERLFIQSSAPADWRRWLLEVTWTLPPAGS